MMILWVTALNTLKLALDISDLPDIWSFMPQQEFVYKKKKKKKKEKTKPKQKQQKGEEISDRQMDHLI